MEMEWAQRRATAEAAMKKKQAELGVRRKELATAKEALGKQRQDVSSSCWPRRCHLQLVANIHDLLTRLALHSLLARQPLPAAVPGATAWMAL